MLSICFFFKAEYKIREVFYYWRCIFYLGKGIGVGIKIFSNQKTLLSHIIWSSVSVYRVTSTWERSKYSIMSLYFCSMPSRSFHLDRLKYLFHSFFATYIREKYDEFMPRISHVITWSRFCYFFMLVCFVSPSTK